MDSHGLEALRLQLLLQLVQAAGHVRPLMDNLCDVTLHMHTFDIKDDAKVEDFRAKMAVVMMACEDIGSLATNLSQVVSKAYQEHLASLGQLDLPKPAEAK